ncbi:MAG: DoxX family protein [Chloroflexi bacterium]|nr:DoxX family protein [Chloroflexota bacterium]
MGSLALLILRLTVGTLMAGHGSQKLFGWFGGSGLEGTRGWLESMGLRPGRPWALSASLSEFGGGLLMLLGFLNPIGALGVIGAMSMATAKAHWGKPIWVSSGGAELPVINTSAALAIALAGSGRYSLDGLLGIRLPRWLLIPGLLGVAASVFFGLTSAQQPGQSKQESTDQSPEEEAGA